MANDDEDTKIGKKPSRRPMKKTLMGVGAMSAEDIAKAKAAEDSAKAASEAPPAKKKAEKAEATTASEKLAQAAAEEAAAKIELADAKAEADPAERKLKSEVAAAKAAEAKADAESASDAAKDERDEGVEAAAEMTKDAATKTRGEALEEAADAEAEQEKKRADSVKPAAPAVAAKVAADAHDEPEMRPALFLAEYETPDDLAHAAEQIRDAGYENWDCHTPYPVHGLDQAMGLKETKIGFISFICGMVGLVSAVLMIQYMNNWDYPIIIGGKPPGSFPSMVPIMFELTVLLTGFGTLFGLFHLARLPRHHHPIFESDRFERATDDRFFISIEVEDPKFDVSKTRALLEKTHPSHLELVEEEIA